MNLYIVLAIYLIGYIVGYFLVKDMCKHTDGVNYHTNGQIVLRVIAALCSWLCLIIWMAERLGPLYEAWSKREGPKWL